MFKTYKKIKFENYVLMSGIIEGILFSVMIFYQNYYFIQIIQFLQLIIVLFVCRRFMKIHLKLARKKEHTKLYN